MDRLDAMRMFVRVVEMGSFAAVAKQLNVARSVVTRQIAALETHLGTRVLARSTRRISLTSAGALYLEKCRVILNLVESAETDVAQARGTPRGPLRVSLPLIYGVRRLAPLLLEFAREHPDVVLSMDFTDQRVNLVEEGIDLAIRITGRLAPTDIARRLGQCKLVIVAAPGYLARHGTPAVPADLNRHQCLGYALTASDAGWPFAGDGQRETIYVTPSLSANNGEVIVAAAVAGMGIAMQPDFIVESSLAARSLVQILEPFPAPELGIYAIFPSNRMIPYRVRALADFLAARLGAPAAV